MHVVYLYMYVCICVCICLLRTCICIYHVYVYVCVYNHISTSVTSGLYSAMAKHKGGVRQRVAQAAADNPRETGRSCLARTLEEKLAWGELSPQQVQQLAQQALLDQETLTGGESMADLRALASIGTSGANLQNCQRDLMRHLEPKVAVPPAYVAKLPFKEPVGARSQAFFLPHIMFSTLYNEFHETFESSVVPNAGELPRFWDSVAHHPQMDRRPVKDRSNFRDRCVPIGVHGDDVPITGIGKGWTSKMTVFSWCSLVALERATREKLFLMYAVFERMRAEDSMEAWMKLLAWSLWWLWLGIWPDSGPDGVKKLALQRMYVSFICRSFHLGLGLKPVSYIKTAEAAYTV